MHQSDVWSHHFVVIYWLASSLLLFIIPYLICMKPRPQNETYGLRLMPCPNAWIIEIYFIFLFHSKHTQLSSQTMATVATKPKNLHMNYDWHKWSKTSMRELLIVIAFLFRLSNICCWTFFSPFLLLCSCVSSSSDSLCWWCRYVFIGWINNEWNLLCTC